MLEEPDISHSEAIGVFFRLAIPSVLFLLIRRVIDIMNLLTVGRLENEDAISGLGLGIITCNVLCFSVAVGLAGGIETLCSQAFGNNQNYLAGCYYNRAQVIVTALFIPQALLLLNISPILQWVGEPVISSEFASEYIVYFLPGLFCYCQLEMLKRFLGTQGEFHLILKIQILTTTLHPLWLYIFVYCLKWEVSGIALATTVSYILTFVLTYGYICFNKSIIKEGAWFFINKDSFVGLIEYLKYGLPSMMLTLMEFWCFETLILLSGLISSNTLGASVIIINMLAFMYMLPLGLSFSTSSLVGNSLGALRAGNAKLFAKISLCTSLILSTTSVTLFLLFKRQIAYLFTPHEEIVNLIVRAVPVIVWLLFGDYMQVIASGSLRAMGYQKYATCISLVGFWCIAIPLAYILAFKFDMGIVGIWTGMPIGVSIISLSYIYIMYSTDWVQLSRDIVDRIRNDKKVKLIDTV